MAERERPGWSAIPAPKRSATAAADSVQADASVPELTHLKQKYFGADGTANGTHAPSDDAEIVTMQPKAAGSDYRAGRKAVVVQKNKLIGVQG